ncbi:MAG: hypothetical protein AAFR38_08595 [Planctomycetota bacterium]
MTTSREEMLLGSFLDSTLPRREWTHRAHIVVAVGLLNRYGLAEAERVMSEGIRALNAAHGTPETATRGYSRTRTCAWLALLADSGRPPSADAARPDLLDPDVLARHYSPQRLSDPSAKERFLGPDLATLPACAAELTPED